MKNICFLFLFFLIISCSKENNSNLISNPNTNISLTIEQNTSNKTFKSKVKSASFMSKSSWWGKTKGDSVQVNRAKKFNLILENNDTITLNLWFQKVESKKLLKLGATLFTNIGYSESGADWDYVNIDDESNLFYNKFDEARLDFGSHRLVYFHQNENFKINKVLKVKEIGVEKNYIEFSFSGNTHPWYPIDTLPVYTITGGSFGGIIK